jgi:hypothetical protein
MAGRGGGRGGGIGEGMEGKGIADGYEVAATSERLSIGSDTRARSRAHGGRMRGQGG